MSKSQESTFKVLDFEKFLQKCLDCPQLELVDLLATKLMASGENYGSLMIRLDATVRQSKNEKSQMLHLVAKTIAPSDQPILDWPLVLKKEVFMYAEILPVYQNLEKEMGIKPVLNSWAKYIGHRYSLNDGEDVVDQHSMLVLENLKTQNFYTGDKRIGLDFEHAKIALTSLARFHSLGIALRRKRPDFYEKVAVQAHVMAVDAVQLDKGYDGILKTFRESPSLRKHSPTIEASFAGVRNGKLFTCKVHEPWVTITHGDFWTNNMMFHKDASGRVDDVKFVDFQMYLQNSPLKDLPYFLSASVNEDAKTNRMDDLLDLYYDTFVRSLERLGCDAGPFTRAAFDAELKRLAISEFPLCALALKFFEYKVDQEKEGQLQVTDVFNSEISEGYVRKLEGLVKIYETKGWF